MISLNKQQVLLKALACLSAGAVMTLAFSPYDQIWLVFISYIVLLYCWNTATAKGAAWFGWLFGVGLQCGGAGWIYYSMHFHGGGSVLFSALVILLLAAYLSIYTALAGYIVNRFCQTSAAMRLMLLYPASYALFEWMQGFVMTGFAWMQPGYTQIDLPLSGFAPVFGSHGVGALVVMTSGFIVYALDKNLDKKLDKTISVQMALIVTLAVWGIGYSLKQVEWTHADGDEIKVSLIQGNIPQEQKWKRENRIPTMNLYRDLTLKNLDADLIIWPETAVPSYQHRVTEYLKSLHDKTKDSHTDVLLGIFILNFETRRYFNSVIDLNGNDYRKRHLVPLGEFVPLRFLIEFFNKWMNIPMSDIASGDDEQKLMEVAGYPASISICFEDAFARDINRDLPEARFLINVSNDAWFEDSREPHQHHSIARMRALETGRYMLRATNTGVTSIIDPHGKVIAIAPQFEETVLSSKVRPMQGVTPYVFWGDFGILFICGFVIGWSVFNVRRVGDSSD